MNDEQGSGTPLTPAPPFGTNLPRGKTAMPVLRAVSTNGRNTPEGNFKKLVGGKRQLSIKKGAKARALDHKVRTLRKPPKKGR